MLVVSNHPESHEQARAALARARALEPLSVRWEVEFVARATTLPPIENWYGAIVGHALEGETVFLHGDDDLFCPGALEDREIAIQSRKAEILITAHAGRLVFAGGKKALGPLPKLSRRLPEVRDLDFSDDLLGNAPFIGNHTYRNTRAFRSALEETRRTCQLQDWLPPDQRELMLPFYLPIHLMLRGGRVCGMDQIFEWRGHDLRELIDSPFGCAHWNNGFLYGATCDYFDLPFLRSISALDGHREVYRKQTSVLYGGVLADRRIPSSVRRDWRDRMDKILRRTKAERIRSAAHLVLEMTGLARLKTRAALFLRPIIDLEADFLDHMFSGAEDLRPQEK